MRFRIEQTMLKGGYADLHRAVDCETDSVCIIKMISGEFPSSEDLNRMRHEFEIAGMVADEGVLKPVEIIDTGHGKAIVFEEFKGELFSDILKKSSLSLERKLRIAVRLAEITGRLHAGKVIHKDIHPKNILYNPETGEIKLTNFHVATRLEKGRQQIKPPEQLEGTLAYISPEQTGRMNRSVDYRTDIYSMGVLFYEMFTGSLPFEAEDAVSLIYAHIAGEPSPPLEVDASVPEMVSLIIMKCLEKSADDRYASDYGLRWDLSECLSSLEKKGTVETFKPCRKDFSTVFKIPEKLYGREIDIARMFEKFDRVRGARAELMLVAGYTGTGKSALVSEIQKKVMHEIKDAGHFIGGKFDQYHRDIPYNAITSAFQGLVHQILMQPETAVAKWKERISGALGGNCQVIVEYIPDLELIVGKQPPVPELPSSEAMNRFNLTFRKFLEVFATVEHPLVLFLDDIHWGDTASLNLIKMLLMDPKMKHFLVIGTYRDNEKEAVERLNLVINEIRQADAPVTMLNLKPMSRTHVRKMVRDTFHCDLKDADDLSRLVMTRTGGNQFFVHEFLKSLYAEHLVSCSPADGKWSWDLELIRSQAVADNVVELMTSKINRLSEETQSVLKYAACAGSRFDLFILKRIYNKPLKELLPFLWEAVKSGLLVTDDDDYKYFQRSRVDEDMDTRSYEKIRFSFLHDRVHQAAYELCSKEAAEDIHVGLARLLRDQQDENKCEDYLFDIANHYIEGAGRVTEKDEQQQIIHYCRKAGIKAKGSGAYEGALRYLKAGMAHLTEKSWEQDYSNTWELVYHLAECEYLNQHFDQADVYIGMLLNHAENTLDKMKIYNLKTVMLISKFQDKEAIDNGIEGLKLLNIQLTPNPEKGEVDALKASLYGLCGNAPVCEALLKRKMTDPEQLAALRLMTEMMVPSYYTRIEFLYVLLLKMIETTFRYGYAEMSCVGFMFYAFALINRFNDYEQARELSKLSMILCDNEESAQYRGKVYSWYNGIVSHWIEPVEDSVKYSLKGKENALEYGDLNSFIYSVHFWISHTYVLGYSLENLYEMVADYNSISCQILKRTINALTGVTEPLENHIEEGYDENLHIESMRQFPSKVPLYNYYTMKIRSLFLAGKYEECAVMGQKADELYRNGILSGGFNIAEVRFIYALGLLEMYPDVNAERRKEFLSVIQNIRKWFEMCSLHCPKNFLDQYHLISAEICRVTGDRINAMDLYDQAVIEAGGNGYLNNEALANELAGRYYLSLGKSKIGMVYLQDAYKLYLRWQAKGKARLLKTEYPQIQIAHDYDTGKSENRNLDILSVFKASQTISGEIVFNRLVKKLMEIMIENAGARKGIFFLRKGTNLVMEAAASVRDGQISVQVHPDSDEIDVPNDLISYVNRTGNEVILNRACEEGAFTDDLYISENYIKSILCAPIKPQGKMRGLFYLENEKSFDIFTPDRLNVLQILSSQAAISIENAGLYSSIEQKVEERTYQLRAANEEIKKLNAMLEKENIRMSSELDVAQQIQQMVLPSKEELQVVEALDIACQMKPADEVGGDYYDVIQQDGSVLIGIGDVTDHGLKSGVLMLMVQTAIQALMKQGNMDRRKLMETLNHTIFLNGRRMKTDRNLTLSLLQYTEGKIHVIGQHEEVLVVRKDRTLEMVDTMELGFPVGLTDEISEYLKEFVIDVEPGDGIVVFTDGITEAENMDGEQYGLKRLCDSIVHNWDKSAEEIKNEVTEGCLNFIGDQKVYDDITIVVAKVR